MSSNNASFDNNLMAIDEIVLDDLVGDENN
jgi:hypothetical protein